MSAELEVFLHGWRVGHLLELDPATWSFVYSDSGNRAPGSGPVSVALPRRFETHTGDPVRAVFANLLPDGALRQRCARSLGLTEGNDFALLRRLGGECAGALRLRQPGRPWPPAAPREPLDDEELRNLAAILPVQPLLAEADGLSKCLNGEFDKLPVRMVEGRPLIVPGHELTTHIIKTARPGLRESVLNEAYCMALAAAWGLPTAETGVLHGKVTVLVSRRLDRAGTDSVRSLHMEDFCQLLGHGPGRRYEREGGPRLADIAAALRAISTQPAVDLRYLLDWVIYSYMVGFGAAHGKQLAVRHGEHGPALAPFFGLWSTHVYPQMSFRLGFCVGDEDRPDWLNPERWRELAQALGMRPQFVLERLQSAAESLPPLSQTVAETSHRRYGFADIVRLIRELVRQRARQTLVALEVDRAGRLRPKIRTSAATVGAGSG